jgi:hypothetical protein
MVAVNLTETRQLREMEALGDNEQLAIQAKGSNNVDQELAALQDTSPLVDIIEPVMQQLVAGLGRMGVFVGSATTTSDITPDLLAAAVSVKEQCDKEILLPMLEMSEHVNARKKELAIMYENQIEQLKTLKAMVSKLKHRTNAIHEKAEVVGTNAKSLAQRSASVLQSSTDLLPTITQSEFDYFQELKRLDEKTKKWQEEVERRNVQVSSLCDALDDGTTSGPLKLPEESIAGSRSLLKATDTMIKKQKERLKEAEERVDELVAVAGIDRDPHGPAGYLQ